MRRLTATTRRSTASESGDLGMLPMINIVFLLLIFFMLFGQLTAADPFRIDPLTSESERDRTPDAILLLIASDGRIAVEGAIVPEAEVGPHVAALIDQRSGRAVQIKADGGLAARRALALLETLRQAGVERAELLTLRTGR